MIPFMYVNAEYLGADDKPAEGKYPAMRIFRFKWDCYVPEIGRVVTCGDNPNLDSNQDIFVNVTDVAQIGLLSQLQLGAVVLGCATTSKVTGPNSSRPKFKILTVIPGSVQDMLSGDVKEAISVAA